ncbi:MAG: hypothetical protein QM723_02710 [Myxococcaceae bacterium]
MHRRNLVAAAIALVLCPGVAFAEADEFVRLKQHSAYLGFSQKYQQFAVRRTLDFRLERKADPWISVAATDLHAKPFTCNTFCASKGLPCTQLEPDSKSAHGGYGWTIMPNRKDYRSRSCDDPLYDHVLALFPESERKQVQFSLSCYCTQPKKPFDDVGGTSMTLDLVEVYTAEGKLKRTFVEKVNEPAVFARLVAQPEVAPIDKDVIPFLKRELLEAEKWKAHSIDGAFQAAPPSVKNASGKCTAELAMPLNQECSDHEGGDCLDVSVSVMGKKVYEGRALENVKLDAWWLPVPSGLLVGVVHYDSLYGETKQHDELLIAPLPKCAK